MPPYRLVFGWWHLYAHFRERRKNIDVFGKKYGSYIIIRPGEESPAIDEMFDLAFETLLEVLKHPLKARGG